MSKNAILLWETEKLMVLFARMIAVADSEDIWGDSGYAWENLCEEMGVSFKGGCDIVKMAQDVCDRKGVNYLTKRWGKK